MIDVDPTMVIEKVCRKCGKKFQSTKSATRALCSACRKKRAGVQ